MNARRSTGRCGFTFLEMVASLAIILMLAGLLFPVYARARESARATSCRSNLAQLGQALSLYAQDYNGRFPPADHEWTTISAVYAKNTGILTCPSEPDDSRRKFGVGSPAPGANGSLVHTYSSYDYRAGLANDGWGDMPIARDWEPWHQRGADVLYLGGYVKWVPTKKAAPVTHTPRPKPATPTGTAAPPILDIFEHSDTD
jgi:prepilin-type N-terminal cleavage/methylation domain-containing protein